MATSADSARPPIVDGINIEMSKDDVRRLWQAIECDRQSGQRRLYTFRSLDSHFITDDELARQFRQAQYCRGGGATRISSRPARGRNEQGVGNHGTLTESPKVLPPLVRTFTSTHLIQIEWMGAKYVYVPGFSLGTVPFVG